jgi:hypothetical protein
MARRVLALAVLLLPVVASAAECPGLLDAIRANFQQKNPLIQYVQILDVKPKRSKYWVIGRGIREDHTFSGSFDDELFGVFVADPTLTRIEVVLDVFPTKRWGDYELWIDSYSMERLTVRGHGATYRDQKFQATYHSTEN